MSAPKGNAGPAHRLRINNVTASIWERTNQHGTFYDVTLQKGFRRGESGEWEYTDTLGRDDLLAAVKVLDWAHTWILRADQDRREREAS